MYAVRPVRPPPPGPPAGGQQAPYTQHLPWGLTEGPAPMSTEKTSWALIPADQAQKKDDFGTIPWGQTRPQGPAKDMAAVGGQNGALGG